MRNLLKLMVRVGVAAVLGLAVAQPAAAAPFTITSVLTGDFRAENPDDLVVNVTITGDTTSNQANWVVDLDSTAHPDAFLGVFAFNLALDAGQSVTFSNFSPSTWSTSISSPATNVPGSGGADFRFEANDPPGGSNNVTNNVLLSFTSTLSVGTWSEANFLNATLSAGAGIPDPGAQLGAHLQSLSTVGCTGCSDSGFASGNYSGSAPTSSVPEPTTLLLVGLGLVAAGIRRARA